MRSCLTIIFMINTLFASFSAYAENIGKVIDIDNTDPTTLFVQVSELKEIRVQKIRLKDLVIPQMDAVVLASAKKGICKLICNKEISWDVLSTSVDGTPMVYAYLHDAWINESIIRYGFAYVSPSPLHPELINSEKEASTFFVGIWRFKNHHQNEAVIVNGSEPAKGYASAAAQVASLTTRVH